MPFLNILLYMGMKSSEAEEEAVSAVDDAHVVAGASIYAVGRIEGVTDLYEVCRTFFIKLDVCPERTVFATVLFVKRHALFVVV